MIQRTLKTQMFNWKVCKLIYSGNIFHLSAPPANSIQLLYYILDVIVINATSLHLFATLRAHLLHISKTDSFPLTQIYCIINFNDQRSLYLFIMFSAVWKTGMIWMYDVEVSTRLITQPVGVTGVHIRDTFMRTDENQVSWSIKYPVSSN